MAVSVQGGQKKASLAAIHGQIASGGSHLDSVGGSSGAPADTTAGGTHGTLSFAGQTSGANDQVVATQTVQPGGVTVHFADGSSLNIVGSHHLGSDFFHH